MYKEDELQQFENSILNMDCLDFLKQCPDNYFDLVLTDPPYKKVKGGCTNHKVKLKGVNLKELKNGKYFKENIIKFSQWLPETFRVLKNNAHIYIFCDDRNMKELLVETEKAQFKLLNILVWRKNKHSPNRYYLKNCEFVAFLRKGKAKNINNMGDYQCLEVDSVEKKIHPTEKPIELIKNLIKNSTKENDIVLDLFSGSGSTAMSALKTNRKFICVEKDFDYWQASCERLKNAQAQ